MTYKSTLLFFIALGSIAIALLSRRYDGIDITPLKEFAISCEPCKQQLADTASFQKGIWCTTPPLPTQQALFVLKHRTIDDEYRKWVLLVYLKLYAKQMELYRIGFEVRESPFILTRFSGKEQLNLAFCRVIEDDFLNRNFGPELLLASHATNYVDENPRFLNDSLIYEQMRLIDSLQTQSSHSLTLQTDRRSITSDL